MVNTSSQPDSLSNEGVTVELQLKKTASMMSAWLKTLGIITIICGAIWALTVIGLLVAWAPIWMGILLFQAGERAYASPFSEDLNQVLKMLEKLRLYFVISGVVTIFSISVAVILAFFLANFFNDFSTKVEDFLYLYQ